MLPLGIASWFGYDLPLEKRLELIARTGFTTTNLWYDEEEPMVSEGRADEMPNMVRQYDLVLDNVHAGFKHCNCLWSESKEEQTLVKVEIEKSLTFCAKHNIPIMVMHISQWPKPPPQTPKGIEIIGELVKKAEKLGVTIALENTLRPDYLEPVFASIKSAKLGFCYDCGHDFLHGQSQGGILKKWGNLLVTTHISDADGIDEAHLQLGEGILDWGKIVQTFPRDSYKGILLLEVQKHDEKTTAENFLKTAYKELKKLAEMLEK